MTWKENSSSPSVRLEVKNKLEDDGFPKMCITAVSLFVSGSYLSLREEEGGFGGRWGGLGGLPVKLEASTLHGRLIKLQWEFYSAGRWTAPFI